MKRKTTSKSARTKIKSAAGLSLPVLPLRAILAALVALLLVVVGFLLADRARLDRRIDSTNLQLSLLTSQVDSDKARLRPVVSPKDNTVQIPELRITLPYDDVTKTLMYYKDDHNNIRLTSSLITDHAVRQLSCDELGRINTFSGTLYSPWEVNAGSVKLQDGRTLNILAARAYKNNQASTLDCATQVWHDITPQQVADEFKQAQSY